MLLPQPIIPALSTKQPQSVGDGLATDVTTTACGIAQKPRDGVDEVFQLIFEGTFTSVDGSFTEGQFSSYLCWRV